MTWDYIRESHPRTAIGYYEPGHYCLVCIMARILDWYNPFMDFGGHITFVQQILYAVPVLLLFTARRI